MYDEEANLSAAIQKYVPSFPEKKAPITAELLLKHQSGIRHYKDDEVRSAVFYNRVGDSLAIFQDDPLLFTPGERFTYTTYGYNVLGAAIEGASGQDYVRYVQEHVCQKAGMTTIQPDNPYKIIPHRAAGYRIKGSLEKGELLNDFMVDVTNKIPSRVVLDGRRSGSICDRPGRRQTGQPRNVGTGCGRRRCPATAKKPVTDTDARSMSSTASG